MSHYWWEFVIGLDNASGKELLSKPLNGSTLIRICGSFNQKSIRQGGFRWKHPNIDIMFWKVMVVDLVDGCGFGSTLEQPLSLIVIWRIGHTVYPIRKYCQLNEQLTLQWCHNWRHSVSNRQPHDCFLDLLFRRRSKKTSKLGVSGLCAGNSPGTGEFTA